MKKFLITAVQILATVAVAAVICVSAFFVAKAVGEPVTEKDEIAMCMAEIVPQYEWQKYAYTAQKAIVREPEKGSCYYMIVVYAADETEVLHRYEFLCRVRYYEGGEPDVDADLVRVDVCKEY